MNGNSAESWNESARKVYGFDTIDGLEKAWLDALRTPPARTAARDNGREQEPDEHHDRSWPSHATTLPRPRRPDRPPTAA